LDFKGFDSSAPGPQQAGPRSVKVMIAGGFGTGKTTTVGSISDIRPLTTEETLTEAGVGVDDLAGLAGKSHTTVSLDFGRVHLNERLTLYLFGTPGQERFWFLWNGLFSGALGAVVLVDTRRLHTSFRAIEELERMRDVPFIVALNVFPDSQDFPLEEVREALDISDEIPIVTCDARERESTRTVLVALVQHVMGRQRPAAVLEHR
jgi:uncharacterized protein